MINENMQRHWRSRLLQVNKTLDIETMEERFVISTLLEDGSAAKLGNNNGLITFDTVQEAQDYIKEIRGENETKTKA